MKCFNCQTELDLTPGEKIGRGKTCDECYADLHCCQMCQFFDESSYNECREPVAQRVVEKEKANFCDYFKLADTNPDYQKDQLLQQAASLFKK